MKHATPRHCKVLALLTLVTLVVSPFLFWTSTFAQAKKPINKDGLVEAIRLKGYTTKELVKQIETRGVSFEMTSEIEAEMRGAGAQPEVIEAARTNHRPTNSSPVENSGAARGTSLTIYSTVPGAMVYLNGQLRGITNDKGVLTIAPLKAARYKVVLKKENYLDQERAVIVAAGAEAEEGFSLTAIQGRLSVNPNIPGAEVKLNGVDYPAGIRDLSLPVQAYEVRVSKPGFKAFTKTVTLNPGGLVTVEAPLEAAPIEESLAQVVSYIQAKRYPEAISSSRELLASHPDNAKANLIMGLAYYYSEQYSGSVEFLAKSMTLGEQVVLPVKHHHSAFLSDDLCTGRITIGRGTLAFSSADRGGHDFSVPANRIYELTPEPRKHGRVHVRVGVQNGSKEDKKTYNFHVIRAFLIQANPSDPQSIRFVRCGNCDEETSLLYQLLRQLKDAPAAALNAPGPIEGSAGLPNLKRRPSEPESINGTSDRPTLTRRPFINTDAGLQPKTGRDPELAFAGRETYQAGGRNWTRYRLIVTNRSAYSDDMFAAAPDLPPCGLNTKASRTWVDIFDRQEKKLYGFCALNSSAGLVSLWFALPEGQPPPSEVFIVLTDRLAKVEYKSNLAAIR